MLLNGFLGLHVFVNMQLKVRWNLLILIPLETVKNIFVGLVLLQIIGSNLQKFITAILNEIHDF